MSYIIEFIFHKCILKFNSFLWALVFMDIMKCLVLRICQFVDSHSTKSYCFYGLYFVKHLVMWICYTKKSKVHAHIKAEVIK